MTVLVFLLLAPLIVLSLCFTIEVFVGLPPLPEANDNLAGTPRGVIVVPAHNEELGLHDSLSELKGAASDSAEILLVADNCQDSTAEIGRNLGVEVIERHDPNRRGKGFALDFARAHLRSNPPDVVVVVDADCVMNGESIRRLVRGCAATGRPSQATNLQQPRRGSSPVVQLSTFAFFVKNVIRQRGLQRLAGRGNLLGTGMAFPWTIFEQADLATGDIVEDLKLGQELGRQGHGPLFVEEASVVSAAETSRNTFHQRRRWEGGFLRIALHVGPSFLIQSLRRADWRGAWAAINTMIPPVALLVLLDLAGMVVGAAAFWLFNAGLWPAAVLGGLLVAALVAIGFAWVAGGHRLVPASSLIRAPLYVIWKVPMYLGFARGGAPEEWQRTDREESERRR